MSITAMGTALLGSISIVQYNHTHKELLHKSIGLIIVIFYLQCCKHSQCLHNVHAKYCNIIKSYIACNCTNFDIYNLVSGLYGNVGTRSRLFVTLYCTADSHGMPVSILDPVTVWERDLYTVHQIPSLYWAYLESCDTLCF